MQNLSKLIEVEKLKVPSFEMDFFQKSILKNLYLEFQLENGKVLISPELEIIVIGDASDVEMDALTEILENRSEALTKVKQYLIYDLTQYSALLETNSFYIKLNQYLLIARFGQVPGITGLFEVRLYTCTQNDIPNNYNDKLYLGRDQLSLKSLRRSYFGLPFIKKSIQEQMMKSKTRIFSEVEEANKRELDSEYLSDLEGLIKEFVEECESILSDFPVDLNSSEVEVKTLIEANKRFRELKHILIVIEQSLQDVEAFMFEKSLTHPVRYITKFKKDVTNDINYFMFKINGRISDYVNKIHI